MNYRTHLYFDKITKNNYYMMNMFNLPSVTVIKKEAYFCD